MSRSIAAVFFKTFTRILSCAMSIWDCVCVCVVSVIGWFEGDVFCDMCVWFLNVVFVLFFGLSDMRDNGDESSDGERIVVDFGLFVFGDDIKM